MAKEARAKNNQGGAAKKKKKKGCQEQKSSEARKPQDVPYGTGLTCKPPSNNIFVTITDGKGNTLSGRAQALLGFRGYRKGTRLPTSRQP